MMKNSNHTTIIYINHENITRIAKQIKLNSTNTNKINFRLIRALMYLFQFRLKVRHHFEKFNIISNAFSRLLTKKTIHEKSINLKTYHDELKDLKNDVIYAHAMTLVKMNTKFKKQTKQKYFENAS